MIDYLNRTKIIATVGPASNSYETLLENIQDKQPDKIIVDLNGFLTLAHLEHIKKTHKVRIIGYLSHVQADLIKKAKEVCDEVYPQSEFSASLARILS